MANPTLHSFRRSQAAAGATPAGGRLRGRLELTLTDLQGAPQPAAQPLEFLLMGSQDVTGLKPGAVRRTYPVNGAFNVEADKCPYVEFVAEDLPWRYSRDPNGNEMRPWLLLIVGAPDEVALLPGSRVLLSQAVVDRYIQRAGLPGKLHLLAHAQEQDGTWVSRLLSPTALEKSQSYVAALIPVFDDRGEFHLPAGKPIPAYYAWHFTTSDTEHGFAELANRLKPLAPTANMGMAAVAYQMEPDQAKVHPGMLVGGALVGPAGNTLNPAWPDVLDHFAAVRPNADPARQFDGAGRPIVQAPLYGKPWLALDQDEPAWMRELNDDPRHRGVAGLGLWAAIEWQDRIVEAAAKQLGAFFTASRRIRQLTLGLAATRYLWDRRLPVDEMHRLQVLGPAMARLATPQGNSVLEQVTAAGHPMPPALFSSAARRLLRPGTARARLVEADALVPGALIERINTCPPDSPHRPDGLVHVNTIVGKDVDQAIGLRLEQEAKFAVGEDVALEALRLHDKEAQRRADVGMDDDVSWFSAVDALEEHETRMALLESARAPIPVRPCEDETHRRSLPKLSAALRDAFDPHGDRAFVVRRVLATIQGVEDQPLTPPELCLDLHIPAWKFLKEFAQDWFLPGLAQMQFEILDATGQLVPDPSADPVIAAQSNGHFTDAFMVGFNQQALAELRWRNVPVAAGCTPLRRFWEPIASGQASKDIVGIHGWQTDTALGDEQHEATEVRVDGGNLVLIFKSQLWRRYPETLIYLLPEKADREPNWDVMHIEPNLHVEIERDVVAFGFARPASILATHWVVIEQAPRGLTFYNQRKWSELARRPDLQPNSARFATAAFARPVRVLIRGTELLPPA